MDANAIVIMDGLKDEISHVGSQLTRIADSLEQLKEIFDEFSREGVPVQASVHNID